MDLSDDGEIKDEFSEISEEEYFDNMASKIEKRKLELELLNQIEEIDDYAKENRYENHRNRPSTSTSRRNNSNSYNRSSSNSFRKEKSRKNSEVRQRSYRATSIFSPRYSLPKRKRQRKKHRYPKAASPVFLSSDDESIVIRDDSDEDEELLALRLQALTSKQEVKELIEEPSSPIADQQPSTPVPSPVSHPQINTNEEEEQLRIDALRSAILKKKDHFRKRKQLMKMENERPYSPTDNFEPIIDVAMDLSSPLGSPFQETICDMNVEVDMDISNSPPHHECNDLEDNRETCDMEIVCSPQPKILSEIESENEEEIALRTMLLSSMNGNNNNNNNNIKKKQEDDAGKISDNEQDISAPSSPQSLIAKNLKMAVERIKQQKQQVPQAAMKQKSGTKTIKMILEEQKNKKQCKESILKEVLAIDEDTSKSIPDNELIYKDSNIECETNNDENAKEVQQETLLIEKISKESLQCVDSSLLDKVSLNIEPSDSSFSTITDTKNIPLLPETKKIDNRLVTSLDSVIRPVSSLIISLGGESSSEDEYDVAAKKDARKMSRSTKKHFDFEKNLDHFLKNIRSQQENSQVTKALSSPILKTSIDNHQSSTSPKTSLSAVKHLPLSSQLEYEKLVQKMKVLQEAKKQKQKAGTLKRTKSSSSATEKSTEIVKSSESNIKKLQKPVPAVGDAQKQSANNPSKIDENIRKIPLLDEAARIRLIEKTENNYLNHSKEVLESTETTENLLDVNCLDIKRREKIESKISEMEKTLIKYKNLLRVVNTRIKSNTPKITSSLRDMINRKKHQSRFGQICKRVGVIVRGESYTLPKYEEAKIEKNFFNISEKTGEIHKIFNEQPFASKQFKILADEVKAFIPKSSENMQEENGSETSVTIATQDNNSQHLEANENSGRAIIRSVSQLIAACENEEECGETVNESPPEKIPEFHRSVKRVLECKESNDIKKKIQRYELPLEFLNSPSSDGNRKSVNQIVCPFSMEGTCNDTQCKYLHL